MISFLTDGCNAIWCSLYFHEGLGVIHEGSIARLLWGKATSAIWYQEIEGYWSRFMRVNPVNSAA